jgi:diguanylate cyclase (GGDEF)-like protein
MSLLPLFDNRTLHLCQMLVATAFALVFFGVHRTHPGLRGVRTVAFSFLLGAPAAFLLSSRDLLPYSAVLLFVAICFAFGAFTLLYNGILHFLGSTLPTYPVLIAGILTIAVSAYSQLHQNVLPPIIAISFTMGLIRGLIAIELFRHAEGRNTLRLFSLSMAVFALMSFYRSLQMLLHGGPADYLQRDSLQTFSLAASVFLTCLTGLFFLLMCNRQIVAMIRNESEQDHLSGALNRRGIELRLDIEFRRVYRGGEPFSIALIDVDHFKAINDSVGHAAGDAVILGVATTISDHLRVTDSLGRFGGDEFLLLLPQTPCHAAQIVVDRLAQFVQFSVPSEAGRPVTLSIGLAEAIPSDSPATLLARADKALYDAKRAGRNCSRALLDESQHQALEIQTPLLVS